MECSSIYGGSEISFVVVKVGYMVDAFNCLDWLCSIIVQKATTGTITTVIVAAVAAAATVTRLIVER